MPFKRLFFIDLFIRYINSITQATYKKSRYLNVVTFYESILVFKNIFTLY